MKDKRQALRIRLAREGMTAIGIDPDDLGGAMQIWNERRSDYVDLIEVFNLLVADEDEITPETAAHARQRLREALRALVALAREVREASSKGDGL